MKTTLYTTLIASTLVFSSQATFAADSPYHPVAHFINPANR